MTTIFPSNRALSPYKRLSRAIPYLAPVAAVCGTMLPLILGLRSLAIVSVYATVPILLASAAYFATDGPDNLEAVVTRPLSTRGLKLSVAGYLFVQAAAIALLSTTTVRPFAYYGLVALSTVLLADQTLRSDLGPGHVAVVLTETSVLLVEVVWSVTLKYHYFFARTDVFAHHRILTDLLTTHHVTNAFGSYQAFPLWHIFVGFQTMLVDGLGPLRISFVTTGVLYGLAPIAVYALARRFRFSRRVSLASAVGTFLNPFVILYGMYAIPRSVTSLLVPICFILLFLADRRASLLYVGLLLGIALYHTVSLPFIFVAVGCYYAIERLLAVSGERPYGRWDTDITTWQLVAIPVVQVGYWIVADPTFIDRILSIALQNDGTEAASGSSVLPAQFIPGPFHELVNYLPFGLIVLFVLFAVVQSAKLRRLPRRNKALLLTALGLAALSVPGPALLVSVVSDITPDMAFRFGQYTYPLVMIAFGVGVVSAARTRWPVGGHHLKTGLVLGLIFSTAFLAVSNDFVASDNPLVEREGIYNFYLSEPETTSYGTITSHTTAPVTSDYVTCRYINNPGAGTCEIIQAEPSSGTLFFPRDSVFVLRTEELRERPLSVYPTPEPVADPPYSNNRDSLTRSSPAWATLSEQNRVYDSAEVAAFTHS